MAAQVAHASLNSALQAKKEWFDQWQREGGKKVVLKVRDLKTLLGLYEKAKKLNLPCSLVKDKGLTELVPGTVTALGIGPGPDEIIDKITGGLPLL